MNKSKLSVRQMCVLALFLAIEIIMYLTPIGYLRINALSVTLMHVPVIILASTMGPAAGAFLGFVFGCTSVIGATMTHLESQALSSLHLSQLVVFLVTSLV